MGDVRLNSPPERLEVESLDIRQIILKGIEQNKCFGPKPLMLDIIERCDDLKQDLGKLKKFMLPTYRIAKRLLKEHPRRYPARPSTRVRHASAEEAKEVLDTIKDTL